MSDPDNKILDEMKAQQERLMHDFNSLKKSVDDILWYHRLGDVARIDKMRMTGPPPRNIPNPTAQGAGNPVVFWSYTFVPKGLDEGGKYPLIVFPHGGVHSNMGSSYAHIIGELIHQGYLVIAPEYRGSTGYGRRFHRLIDYGGLEVEDTYAARNWMVENSGLVDPERVGIMGWSHGGLHALMNVFSHPDDYKAAFAGVPVSDLVARMGYKTQHYRDLYSADYHIGKTAYEDVNEYRRRVEHLIKSLKAAGKDFEYKVFEGAPGGHVFDRLDTRLAREAREEIYRFLARYLSPPNPTGSP
jgi:dipeptidyl aminopeptidase/acylaminoacyl peptidase